jgi:enamine deaminase RidA (YjgF/YER057c/UK114 family)
MDELQLYGITNLALGNGRASSLTPDDAWVSPGNTLARATVEAKLAAPQYLVEIMVVAAK